jgi:hypothetical protein
MNKLPKEVICRVFAHFARAPFFFAAGVGPGAGAIECNFGEILFHCLALSIEGQPGLAFECT